jgi:hypothetical protein
VRKFIRFFPPCWGSGELTSTLNVVPVFIATDTCFLMMFPISGVGLSPLGTAATSGLLYKPQMTDEGDCGAIGG